MICKEEACWMLYQWRVLGYQTTCEGVCSVLCNASSAHSDDSWESSCHQYDLFDVRQPLTDQMVLPLSRYSLCGRSGRGGGRRAAALVEATGGEAYKSAADNAAVEHPCWAKSLLHSQHPQIPVMQITIPSRQHGGPGCGLGSWVKGFNVDLGRLPAQPRAHAGATHSLSTICT